MKFSSLKHTNSNGFKYFQSAPKVVQRPSRTHAGKRILPEYQQPLRFCELCGSGSGLIPCPRCDGEGKVPTKPGGAGVAGVVGLARCKLCNGLGKVPCALCGGYELKLPPPQPFRSAKDSQDDDDDWNAE